MIVRARTLYRPRFGFYGLGAVTPSQLQQQTPGQQPSFITGSYPDATWTAYNDFNNGYGVYLPYTTGQINASGPPNPQMVGANSQVTQQFSALLMQAFPAMQTTITTPSEYAQAQANAALVAAKAAGTQFAAAPVAAPVPVVAPVAQPVAIVAPSPSSTAQTGAVPNVAPSSEPVYVYQTDGGNVPSSGFDLSSIPWWAWAGLAAIGLYMVMK